LASTPDEWTIEVVQQTAKKVMKKFGLGLWTDDHIAMHVTHTDCPMKVPGVPTSEMLRLCKPLTENLLVMDVLNVAVFSGSEVDSYQGTKFGSTPVMKLAGIVDELSRKIVSTAVTNMRQNLPPDRGSTFKWFDNYSFRVTKGDLLTTVSSVMDLAGRKVVVDQTPADVESVHSALLWHMQNLGNDDNLPPGVTFNGTNHLKNFTQNNAYREDNREPYASSSENNKKFKAITSSKKKDSEIFESYDKSDVRWKLTVEEIELIMAKRRESSSSSGSSSSKPSPVESRVQFLDDDDESESSEEEEVEEDEYLYEHD
jgi:hypothetical protein